MSGNVVFREKSHRFAPVSFLCDSSANMGMYDILLWLTMWAEIVTKSPLFPYTADILVSSEYFLCRVNVNLSLAEASFHAFLKAVWEENIKSKPYISCPINFRKKLRLGSHNLSVEFEINKNTKYLITVIENKQEVLTLNNNIVTFHNFSS